MLSKIIEFCVDIIFPKDSYIEEIESLTPALFFEKADKNIEHLPVKALFSYKDPLVHSALWELKYKHNPTITYILATLLYDFIIQDVEDILAFESPDNILIVPIPLSKKRFKERGYNQAEILIDAMPKGFGKKNTEVLTKVKHTVSQTSLDKKQRLKNLKNCFIATEEVKDKIIILIDDVYTTGATLLEAKQALLEKGASEVYMYAVAH